MAKDSRHCGRRLIPRQGRCGGCDLRLYRGLCQSLRHPHRPYGTAAFHDWAQKLRLPLFFSGKILYNGICLFRTLFKWLVSQWQAKLYFPNYDSLCSSGNFLAGGRLMTSPQAERFAVQVKSLNGNPSLGALRIWFLIPCSF